MDMDGLQKTSGFFYSRIRTAAKLRWCRMDRSVCNVQRAEANVCELEQLCGSLHFCASLCRSSAQSRSRIAIFPILMVFPFPTEIVEILACICKYLQSWLLGNGVEERAGVGCSCGIRLTWNGDRIWYLKFQRGWVVQCIWNGAHLSSRRWSPATY